MHTRFCGVELGQTRIAETNLQYRQYLDGALRLTVPFSSVAHIIDHFHPYHYTELALKLSLNWWDASPKRQRCLEPSTTQRRIAPHTLCAQSSTMIQDILAVSFTTLHPIQVVATDSFLTAACPRGGPVVDSMEEHRRRFLPGHLRPRELAPIPSIRRSKAHHPSQSPRC